MELMVYEFNKTIYRGNVTIDFYLFSLKRNPTLLRFLLYQLFVFLKFSIDLITQTEFKEGMLSFVKGIKNMDQEVESFWLKNADKLLDWYKVRNHDKDVIITAAPEFLILPVLQSLGIYRVIASLVDPKTGALLSPDCYGEEKLKRFSQQFPMGIKDCFLHSTSDIGFAALAENSYIVSKGIVYPWEGFEQSGFDKLGEIFLKKDFIVFLIIGVINTFNGVILAFIYSQFTDPNLAFALGYGTSLLISYLLNSRFTFKETLSLVKFIKFSISYIPNFIIQFIIVLIFYNLIRCPKLFAYTLAAIIGVPITFLVLKVFAFAHKKQS